MLGLTSHLFRLNVMYNLYGELYDMPSNTILVCGAQVPADYIISRHDVRPNVALSHASIAPSLYCA